MCTEMQSNENNEDNAKVTAYMNATICVKPLSIHTPTFNEIQRPVQKKLDGPNLRIVPQFSEQMKKFESILGYELEEVKW